MEKPQQLTEEELRALIYEKNAIFPDYVMGDPVATRRVKEIRKIIKPLQEQVMATLTRNQH